MMFDSKRSGKRWNITFYDYSSNIGGAEAGPDYSKYHKNIIFFEVGCSKKINEVLYPLLHCILFQI